MNQNPFTNSVPHRPVRRPNSHAPAGGKVLLWILAIAALLTGTGFWWFKGRVNGPADATSTTASGSPGAAGGGRRFGNGRDTQPVSVQTARLQDIRVSVNAIGSIVASNTATVHAQVSGVLQNISFQEGQQVRAGAVIAQIDPRAFQATVNQALGALARDTAQLDNAKIDLLRYRDLASKEAIPSQQLDTQQALVRQLEGSVKVDQAALESAQLQLSYTKVLAPISGRAGLKLVDLGNVVQQADPNGIVVITQTRPIALTFAVPADYVPTITERLRANQPLPVQAWSQSGNKQLAVGRVATLDNAIDTATNTIKVKALFPNADDALFPNQSVSVRLQLDTKANALSVPQAAVLRGSQGFYVYAVNADNTVSTRVVKPGPVDGDWMAVEGPIKPGDKVVIDGTDRLREGAKIEVIAADPQQRNGAVAPTKRSSAPDSGNAGPDKSRWMDKLSPADAEKVKNMTPDERKAWRQKQHEQAGGGAPAVDTPSR